MEKGLYLAEVRWNRDFYYFCIIKEDSLVSVGYKGPDDHWVESLKSVELNLRDNGTGQIRLSDHPVYQRRGVVDIHKGSLCLRVLRLVRLPLTKDFICLPNIALLALSKNYCSAFENS